MFVSMKTAGFPVGNFPVMLQGSYRHDIVTQTKGRNKELRNKSHGMLLIRDLNLSLNLTV